jgi:solute carrier family 25, member 42
VRVIGTRADRDQFNQSNSCLGAVSKTTIAPLDRAKINFQGTEEKRRTKKQELVVVRANKFSYRLCFQFIRDTYRNDGFFSLYRGNTANLARVIPSAAIYYTAHEQWKRILGTDEYE